jgi:hypothetical protein
MKKKRSSQKQFQPVVITVCMFYLLLNLSCADSESKSVHFDELIFSDFKNVRKHHTIFHGESELKTIPANVGGLHDEYQVRSLGAKGSSIFFIMKGNPSQPMTLEFEEIHSRRSENCFAYSVRAGGEDIYFRTYKEASCGPSHFFVEVPSHLVGKSGLAEIEVINECDGIINLSRVWAYSGFDSLAVSEKVFRDMRIGLFQPRLTFNDYEADLIMLKKIKKDFDFRNFPVGFGFDLRYMTAPEDEVKKQIDWLLRLSSDSRSPFFLSINSWWSGTPSGPDGLGGYWQDIPYQQIVYDPENNDNKGKYRLSTPNMWSSTPWLSMNNRHYNSVRQAKIRLFTSYISQCTAKYALNGIPLPVITVFTENEPLYWPYFAYHITSGGADFSPLTVADAANDSVLLDPSDGLNEEEKFWLCKNQNDYIQIVGDGISEGYGYNYIIVKGNNSIYPDEQLIENAYSHMFIKPTYPNWDINHSAWETHILPQLRFGGEWDGTEDYRYLDYIAARGKFADVNSERSAMSDEDFALFKQAYACGADHVTIYNFRHDDNKLIRYFDGIEDMPFEMPAYENCFFDHSYMTGKKIETYNCIVDYERIQSVPLFGPHVLCFKDTGSVQRYGSLFYKINRGGQFDTGTIVECDGIVSRTGENGSRIEIYAGDSKEKMSLVREIHSLPAKTDISGFISKNSSTAYFELRLFGSNPENSAIKRVAAYIPWGKKTGQTDRSVYTYKQMRTRSLWITYRADTERMMKIYLAAVESKKVDKDIITAYKTGHYITAYRLLSEKLSETQPAKYLVRGSGRLFPYDISLDAGNKDIYATVLTPHRVIIRSAETDTSRITVKLRFGSLANGNYQLFCSGDTVSLKKLNRKNHDSFHVSKGEAAGEIMAAGESKKIYPATFEARYVANRRPDAIQIQSQTPSIGEYANYVSLFLSDTVSIMKEKVSGESIVYERISLPELNRGDRLQISMDNSQKISEIIASSGKISGKVVKMEEMSITGELKNPFITIESENGTEYRFEIGCECTLDISSATGKNTRLADAGNIGIKTGREVIIHYSPYPAGSSIKRALIIRDKYK